MTKARRIYSYLLSAAVVCCTIWRGGAAPSSSASSPSVTSFSLPGVSSSSAPTPTATANASLPINLPILPSNLADLAQLNVGIVIPDPSKLIPNDTAVQALVGGGIAAIQLAAMEINNRSLIPGVYVNLTYGLYGYQSANDKAKSIFATSDLIRSNVSAVIGDAYSVSTFLSAAMTGKTNIPQCSFAAGNEQLSDKSQYPTFFRTITTAAFGDPLVALFQNQNWKTIGVVYSPDDNTKSRECGFAVLSNQLTSQLVSTCRDAGITVDFQETTSILGNSALQRELLITLLFSCSAGKQGFMIDDYVWITLNPIAEDIAIAVLNNTATAATNATDLLKPFDGIIMLNQVWNLTGLPEYDQFLAKWSQLPSNIFYGQAPNFLPHNQPQGIYCFIVFVNMNRIFLFMHVRPCIGNKPSKQIPWKEMRSAMYSSKILNNYPGGRQAGLHDLSKGLFNQNAGPLTPLLFNTNWTGPAGGANEFYCDWNFEYLYVKNGTAVRFATNYDGSFNLVLPPYFHDGTSNTPKDRANPASVYLHYQNICQLLFVLVRSFRSQQSTTCSYCYSCEPASHKPWHCHHIGNLCLWSSMLSRRDVDYHSIPKGRCRQSFKVSSWKSPLFCCFELLGLMFAFGSIASFTLIPTVAICSLRPICLAVSFVLVLGNIIAKTFRIYRIFDNSFALKSNTITNRYLSTIVIALLAGALVIVGLWLILDPPVPMLTAVNTLSSAWTCNSRYYTVGRTGTSLFEIFLIIYLGSLVLVASILAYKTRGVDDMYGESKQIAFVSYNMMIAGIICIPTLFLPSTEFLASYYLCISALLFAAVFALIALFVPKMIAIIKHHKLKKHTRSTATRATRPTHATWDTSKIALSAIMPKFDGVDMVLDAHEGVLPVRIQKKNMPYFSRWETKRLVVITKMGYFMLIDRETHKAVSYPFMSCKAITTNNHDDYIFQVTGVANHEFYFQVKDAVSLDKWIQRFQDTQPNPRRDLPLPNSTRTTPDSSNRADELSDESDLELNLFNRPRNRLTETLSGIAKDKGTI
ncbi:7 transmembrane sweet-taste receptor of 3 GCPR-domain-containing protein [Jimgerdemannia flammicorona]|uniref:7 transmembrane sweet-taste receptor of 3 GCPR-domain-containing protein n=1 Tax=Jimgerdemannia flammicorona TaxID=994334 RepID=A0A433DCN2_9FUNG|nr:7 transmembrane sweet-taste receptor of 3 GCPR-domain-containing protein [Jimgerdemannia flammicorona]